MSAGTIDHVALRNGALLGMGACPGRRWLGMFGKDLRAALREIRQWGDSTVLSLVEAHEFALLGVPDFEQAVADAGMVWLHVPIVDMYAPGPDAVTAWQRHRDALRTALQRGDKVFVHCAAGLGRTGTLVARLLVDDGLTPAEAIARVRRARPGTIQTAPQAAFVADDKLFTLRAS